MKEEKIRVEHDTDSVQINTTRESLVISLPPNFLVWSINPRGDRTFISVVNAVNSEQEVEKPEVPPEPPTEQESHEEDAG